MVSLVSNQCKYCNSNNDVWVIKRRTNFYSIAPLLWELYLILENPWLNTKLPHILCGSTRLVVGISTFHNRAGEQPTLRVGQAGIYHHFCSFYLPYRTLHLIKGAFKSIWKSREKTGVCAVTPSNCCKTEGRAELESMMWNGAAKVLRFWHGKHAKARWESQLSQSEVIPTFPAQGGVKTLCTVHTGLSLLSFLIGN